MPHAQLATRIALALILAVPLHAQLGQAQDEPAVDQLVAVNFEPPGNDCILPGTPWSRLPDSIRRDLEAPLNEFERRGFAASWFTDQHSAWRAEKGRRTFAQLWFDDLLDAGGRRHLLMLYAKVLNEGFWDRIAVLFPAWGAHGSFFMLPKDRAAFESDLDAKGYDCSWLAAGSSASWGVRSPKPGCQIHLRHFLPTVDFYQAIHALDPGFLYLHVDMNNPGTPGPCTVAGFLNPLTVMDPRRLPRGIKHLEEDHLKSGQYSFWDYKRAIEAQGIWVPDVDACPSLANAAAGATRG